MVTILGYKTEFLKSIEIIDIDENKIIVMFCSKANQIYIDGNVRLNQKQQKI